MFNYLGTIKRIDSTLPIYYVSVPQISSDELPAKAIAVPGIEPRYAIGDVVVLAELENVALDYIILGRIVTTVPPISAISATHMTITSGKIGKDVLCEKEYSGQVSTVPAGLLFAQAYLAGSAFSQLNPKKDSKEDAQ